MKTYGTFKIHFNRHQAYPLVWCIKSENWELAVKSVELVGTTKSKYIIKREDDDDDGNPSAWFEITGTMELDEDTGAAIVTY